MAIKKPQTQKQITEFFEWAVVHAGAKWQNCDESEHLYVDELYIGGWFGDDRTFGLPMDHLHCLNGLENLLVRYYSDIMTREFCNNKNS